MRSSAPCASTSWAWRTGRPPPGNCASWKRAWPGAWRKARGISAGLIYTPNKYQSTEEPVALAKAVARCDGILDMHMRNEADHMAEALEEAIRIGRETGIRILVTHFKLRGRRN